jgi:hypothetical protein
MQRPTVGFRLNEQKHSSAEPTDGLKRLRARVVPLAVYISGFEDLGVCVLSH